MSNVNRFLSQQLQANNDSVPNLVLSAEGQNNVSIPSSHSKTFSWDMNSANTSSQQQQQQQQQPPSHLYNVPMQQSSSFGMVDNTGQQSYDLYNQSVLNTSHTGGSSHAAQQYNMISHSNMNGSQFNSGIPSMPSLSANNMRILPTQSATTMNLLQQQQQQQQQLSSSSQQQQSNAHATLLPAAVSMTPQLSVNSTLGMNDIGSPDLTANMNNLSLGAEISNVPSRTVYLGNIPNDLSAYELLNHVRSGTVESLKMVPSKNCAFISFLDEKSATLFHSDAILKRLTINNHDIKIGWGKPTPVQPVVASCVSRYNATRNVYVGNLPANVSEQELFMDFKEYGDIDTIKILNDKKIAFVHFTSILAAIRCVQSLPLVEAYKDRKIFYGKDRCAFITKTQQHNAAQYLGLNPNTDNFLNQVDRDLIANALVQQSNAAAMIATSTGGNSNLGNRTIYLGNLHPESTIEEICNVVRGGILQNVRLISERHVCFITFIDPISAAQFYAMSSLHGLIIHNRKIKVGWGKHSGPLPNSINLAVGNGASRNIYIGGLDKIPEIQFTKEKLYDDFKEFGDIEQINFFQERHCCFVNFTNISNAIKAIDGIRNNVDYHRCKINFGKDRCGNTPRQFQLSVNGNGSNSASDNINGPDRGNSSTGNVGGTQQPFNMNGFSHDFNSGIPTENDANNSQLYNYSSNSEDDDGDDYIDDAKVRFQPLGITLENQQNL